MTRFIIDVIVVIATPQGRFATADGRLPGETLGPDRSPFDLAHDVLSEITGIDGRSWLALRQVGLVDDPGERKTLLYAVELPEAVPLRGRHAAWSRHEELDASSYRLCALAYQQMR